MRAHQLGGQGVLPRRRWLPKERNFCNARPHCLGAVGSATPAMHCLTAWGQWAVERLSCTTTLPGGSGQWNSCNALPHCLGEWAVQLLQYIASLPGGSGPCNSCNALPHYLGEWAVQLLQYIDSLPGGSGQCNSCHTLPHSLVAVGSGARAMRGPTSCGDGESCLGGGRCLKSRTRAMHCHTAWGQWAVELLLCTATLPGGSGQCNSCNTLPHCLGAVGSATPAMQCHTV